LELRSRYHVAAGALKIAVLMPTTAAQVDQRPTGISWIDRASV
jgi:hypothetical protein